MTLSEPLISGILEELISDSECDRWASLLERAWKTLLELKGEGISSHKGDEGDLSAKVLAIAATDTCPRPLGSARRKTSIQERFCAAPRPVDQNMCATTRCNSLHAIIETLALVQLQSSIKKVPQGSRLWQAK